MSEGKKLDWKDNSVDEFIDSLDLEGEPKYFMLVELDFVKDIERLESFLNDWNEGLVEPYAMAEGSVTYRWKKIDLLEGK